MWSKVAHDMSEQKIANNDYLHQASRLSIKLMRLLVTKILLLMTKYFFAHVRIVSNYVWVTYKWRKIFLKCHILMPLVVNKKIWKCQSCANEAQICS